MCDGRVSIIGLKSTTQEAIGWYTHGRNLGGDTGDMSPALFQKAVLVPCSFHRPETMLRYGRQALGPSGNGRSS